MVDDWIAGVAVLVVAIVAVVAAVALTSAGSVPAWGQQFRAAQFVADQEAPMLTNREVISWIDSHGKQRTITVDREVQ